jgi:glycosyltransferase involved in cell wall biosynthesis
LRNVVITNLFVPHVDGASAKDSNVDRQALLTSNLAKLRALYPNYDASVQEFIHNDPLRPVRDFMNLVILRTKKRPAATLYVHNPELSGGSSRYLEHLLAQRSQKGEALILAATSKGSFIQLSLDESRERVEIKDSQHFRDLLTALNIRHIIVNQMVGSAYDTLVEHIHTSGVPYTVYLHDFFFACPTITLIGHTGRYCGAETRVSECSACLRRCFGKSSSTSQLSITAWREQSYEFLSGASSLVTVSEHTRNLYQRYFPSLSIHVEEPVVEISTPMPVRHNSALSLPIMNVAVIGAIGKHKGSDLIYEMVEILRNRALPIKIVVCGSTDRHSESYIDRDGFFEVTGKYDPLELPKLLAQHRIAFTLLPSIWPETFLFTASESLACGYPVMVSGLTAAAERVLERDAGWVLHDLTAFGIIAELERIFYNREEISEKTRNLLSTQGATADPNAPLVVADQHPFKEFLVEL